MRTAQIGSGVGEGFGPGAGGGIGLGSGVGGGLGNGRGPGLSFAAFRQSSWPATRRRFARICRIRSAILGSIAAPSFPFKIAAQRHVTAGGSA